MSIFPAAFLPSEIRSSSKLGSCRSDPRPFRCLPNTAVVERDALGAPTHRSLWGGTQDPSPFTYLRELSNRFGSMRVCTAQAVLAISHAFMTSVIHRQFIDSPRGIEKARTYRNSCHNSQSTWPHTFGGHTGVSDYD